MALIVPIQPIPNQTVNVQLGGQNVTLNVYQNAFGLFIDVLLSSTLVIGGVLCQNANRIVRDLYLGFSGDFVFVDQQPDPVNGPLNPVYTGLGGRYLLYWLAPSDLPSGVG